MKRCFVVIYGNGLCTLLEDEQVFACHNVPSPKSELVSIIDSKKSVEIARGSIMQELSNCPNCDQLFVKTAFRDVCDACFKEEEKQFEAVYTFIRKRENRTATMLQVVEGTGVPEKLIIKFIKKGRLQLSKFPGLTYPCEKCGTPIREGKLCTSCQTKLRSQIEQLKKEEERQQEMEKREKTVTYFTNEKKK